jgi:hypothetical protein
MTNHNAANERIKRHYFTYLVEALGHSEETIDAVAKAIARFEAYTRYKDFKVFHIEQEATVVLRHFFGTACSAPFAHKSLQNSPLKVRPLSHFQDVIGCRAISLGHVK